MSGIALALGGVAGVYHPVQADDGLCMGDHLDVSPALTDLGSQTYSRMDGEVTAYSGGLYSGGSNTRPEAHHAAGLELAASVVPRLADGSHDPAHGTIAMISVGMSNTASEFRTFRDLARNDPEINPQLVLVNGATAGRTAEYWADPNSDSWQLVNDRLTAAGLTPAQVQVAWIKLTRTGGGEFPAKAQVLQSDLAAVARNLRNKYPNLKLAFYSSRTRSYTYWYGLSPEPPAFETGFAVKWLIEQQINGDPDLNYDPARGAALAPWIAWGPYLWIDGLNPRSDGRIWPQQDLEPDCTHPSASGNAKVAEMLLDFFKTDPAAQIWFLTEPPAAVTYRLYLPFVPASLASQVGPAGWPNTWLPSQSGANRE